ncbi:hypothetical protein WDW86_19960 [Bdellovibrionota bacterium FG-2]
MMALIDYFPTLFWVLGLIEFLSIVLFQGPQSRTSGVSVWVSLIVLSAAVVGQRRVLHERVRASFRDFRAAPWSFHILFVLTAMIFILSAVEARLPPHLPQEYDAINYHMGLPRQHLIQGTLSFLDWSTADLWPATVQWGFASSWFSGAFPQKIPQFLCSFWAFLVMVRLGRRLLTGSFLGWVPALAVFSAHGVVIQLGTAMLDLTHLYFLLAAIDGFLSDRKVSAALNLALFATLKAFGPIQVIIVLACFGALAGYSYPRLFRSWARKLAPVIGLAVLFSLLLLSRTIWVDMKRAGTPLFPLATCLVSSVSGCSGWEGVAIRKSSQQLFVAANGYGMGRGIGSFLNHLWRVAVPGGGVNNSYDYPLGLPWLLWCLFFVFSLPEIFRSRRVPVFIALSASFWLVWWLGSQQSRWLYPVLALGWLGTLEIQKRVRAHVLCICLVISASFSLISHYRAFRADIWKSPSEIYEQQVKSLKWDATGKVPLSKEMLYVDRPVTDHKPESLIWILR